jgi:hypothetical protein
MAGSDGVDASGNRPSAGAGGTSSQVIDLAIRFSAVLVGAVASLGFVAFVGAVILWSRFEAAQLPADRAVALQPRADLVAVGAIALVLFALGGLVAVLLLYLLDRQGTASLRTRTGLLVVLALEVAAAFVVEEWERRDWVAVVAAVAGVVALAALVERAAWWYDRNAERPYRKLAQRAWAVFCSGVAGVDRALLWLAVAAAAAAVVAVAVVDPALPRYAVTVAALAAVAAVARRARGGPERTWAVVVLALGALMSAGIVLVRENDWVAQVAGVALVLTAANLGVAKGTGRRFAWYGVAVFASVVLFGASFHFLRALEDPQAQGVALLRTNDAEPICGVFVGETEDRIYYARVDLAGRGSGRRLRNDSGRLLWAPRDRLVSWALGPLEPARRAQDTALRMRRELALDREPRTEGGAPPADPPAERPPGASGADPCGPPEPTDALPATPERTLAQRFQPRLLLAADDGFWPVSVLTVFELEHRGRGVCRRPICVPVRSAGDLPYVGGETEWLEFPAAFDDTGGQRRDMLQALGTSDPYRTARQYFLRAGGGEDATTSLQYWYFYLFNYQPLRRVGLRAGFHEGDFEHVGILLSKENRPRAVWMARHDDEGQVFLWDEPALRRREDHVDVYVARGSHASYEACAEQARRKAPFGFINDRPECRPGNQLVLDPGQVPLLNLAQARWACWGGRFGHTRPGLSRLEFELYEANGPRSPLWQQRYAGTHSAPCAGVEVPQPAPAGGEEPLDAGHAARLAERAGRLDPLVDDCADWQRAQAQGAYVSACRQEDLAAWAAGGFEDHDGPALRVRMAGERPRREDPKPIAVRRNALEPAFHGWQVEASAETTADVYVSCLIGERPVEALFRGVALRAREPLTLDDRLPGRWRLLHGVQEVASEPPVLAPEARSGVNAARRQPGGDTRCR